MYCRLVLEANALDLISGTLYYNDKSHILLTTDPLEATALPEEDAEAIKEFIISRVDVLIELLTDENGFFDKKARLDDIPWDFKVPLVILSTTIGNIITMGIKKETEPCESAFMLEFTKLNNYWLKIETSHDIINNLKETVFGE